MTGVVKKGEKLYIANTDVVYMGDLRSSQCELFVLWEARFRSATLHIFSYKKPDQVSN
jgi:hypothetical protein